MPKKKELEFACVVVNTHSARQADKIGKAALMKRLIACYSLMPKIKSVYYWPPKSNKLETSKGPLLTMDTLPRNYGKLVKLVREMHSDRVPLIGVWEIEDVQQDFYKWLNEEIV